MERRPYFDRAKRVVVKVGSNVLTGANGLETGFIASIGRQISEITGLGLEVLVVSSGAMAVGQKKMAIPRRPENIPGRQAVAAVGQSGLMLAYENAFAPPQPESGSDTAHKRRPAGKPPQILKYTQHDKYADFVGRRPHYQ